MAQMLTSLISSLNFTCATYFVVAVVGFIVREDGYGVTSFVRALNLPGNCYNGLICFFKKSSVDKMILEQKWWHVVDTMCFPCTIDGKMILIIDGTKVIKEGKRMPSIKKLGQTSEDQTKPTFIWGTNYQSVSLLCGNENNKFCIPLTMPIVDGVSATADWEDSPYKKESQIVRAANDACEIAKELNKRAIVLGDRYYLSRNAVKILLEYNKSHPGYELYLVSKAKSNYTAYLPLTEEEKKDKRRKKGEKVKLFDFFDDVNTQFEEKTVFLYDKETEVKVARKELLWGYGVYVPMSFVLVQYWDDEKGTLRREVLGSMDTTLSTTEIMQLYSCRFKIEVQFKDMKSHVKTFSYRFWSKCQPLLNKKRKKGDPDPLESVTDPEARKLILKTLNATELFVFCGMVAQGIIQAIAIRYSIEGDLSKLRFQRTKANDIPSVENIMYVIRKNLNKYMYFNPDNLISFHIRMLVNKASWNELKKKRHV